MTSKPTLKQVKDLAAGAGKENNALAVQNGSKSDHTLHLLDGAHRVSNSRKDSARNVVDDKKRANLKKQSQQRAHTQYDDEEPKMNEPQAEALRRLKVFQYHLQDKRDSQRDEALRTAELLNEQLAGFHSANPKGVDQILSGRQAGNQTMLNLRQLNDDLRGFKTPQEIQTSKGSSNRAGIRQKSRTRPETQLHKSKAAKQLLAESITQEQAIAHEFQLNEKSKEIVGRIVGAPNLVVTSNLNKDEELLKQERQREMVVLDMIANNIVNQHSSSLSKYQRQSLSPSRQNLSFVPEKHFERRRKNDQKMSSILPGGRQRKQRSNENSKNKISKSQDLIRPNASKHTISKLNQLKYKPKQFSLIEYLDSSIAGQEPPLATLNILTATAGQFVHNKARDKSKSAVHHTHVGRDDYDPKRPSNEKDRSLIQTKLLNFQRDARDVSNKKQHSRDKNKKEIRSHSRKNLGGRDSSNSRSRSKDLLSKEASRDRYTVMNKTSVAAPPGPPLATISQHDADLVKKRQKASNNLLAMINLSKNKKVQETEQLGLKSAGSPEKRKLSDEKKVSRLPDNRKARANQSLSPRNTIDKYKANVPQNLRSQNLLSNNINISSSHKNVARSAPRLQNVASIDVSAINSSIERELANDTEETVNIIRHARLAVERANERKKKISQPTLDDIASESHKKGKKSRSPNQDRTGKPPASKIDKIIRENLKKQIRKDLELKEKERLIKLEQKRKRAELEQANERARRQTESQVQRSKEKMHKLQIMKQLQLNLAASGLTSTAPLNEKTLDANLQHLLGRSEKDEITAEMTKLLQQIDERPSLQKRIKPKAKEVQTQHQTQKMDGQNYIEQLESLLENHSFHHGSELQKIEAGDHSHGESQILLKKKDKGLADDKRDQRRSNGLDFIDMRKEILSELKQLGHNFKNKKADKQLKATIQNEDKNNQNDLAELLTAKHGAQTTTQLRGSVSQRQIEKAMARKIKAKKPVFKKAELLQHVIGKEKPDLTSDINASFHNEPARQIKPFSLDISKLLERATMQQQEQSQTGPLKKEMIRRFMKEKQKRNTQEAEKQKHDEIKKTLKVHANLMKLNNYCKKQMLNTTGRAAAIQLTNKISVPSVIIPRGTIKIKERQDQKKSDLEVIEANELTITPNRMLFEESEPSLNVSGTRISRGGTAAQSRKDVSLRARQADTADDLYEDSKMQSMQTLEERPINSIRLQRPITSKRPNKFQAELAPCFEKSNSARALRAQFGKKSQSPPKPLAEKKTSQSMIAGNTVKVVQPSTKETMKNRNQKQRKRVKSITKGAGGPNTYMQNGTASLKTSLNQRLRVKIPKIKMQKRSSSADSLDSHDEDSFRGRRYSQNRNSSSLKKHHQRARAATKIQREVRKYLQRLGFYEAKEILSPEREPQINLFIEKKINPIIEVKAHKKKSKSRSGSRSSGKKGRRVNKPESKRIISPQRKSAAKSQQKLSPEKGSLTRKPMQKTTIIAEISGFKQRRFDNERRSHGSQGRLEMDNSEVEGHHRDKSLQLEESNYPSAKSGLKLSGMQPSPDEDGPIESGRIVNLNKVQVIQNFAKMTFLDGLPEADSQKISPQLPARKQENGSKRSKPKQTKKKAFNYKPELPVSESILDRLQGNTAANNFNQEDELFKRDKLPALMEDKVENRNDNLWLPSTEQMKSVQTPRSGTNMAYTEVKSHQSLNGILQSASVSDQRRAESGSLEKSSKEFGGDAVSQSSSSVFDRNAFQQFTNNQKSQMMQNADYQKLIKFREDCLKMKEHKEKKHIQKLFKNNQCSPRTYHARREQIDKWVHIERLEIEKTKVTFQQEWDKTVKMIEDTQKSVDEIRSKIQVKHSNTNSNHMIASSGTSAQKPVQGSSVNGSAKKNSILIEDPPKSYRSNHQEQAVLSIERPSGLSSHRSATYGQPADHLLQYLEKRMAGQHESAEPVRTTESDPLKPHKTVQAQENESNQRFRANSNSDSEYSQQPSAEFLERLERAKKQEQNMMNINLGGLEPEFDGKLEELSHDEGVDSMGEFAPGLVVNENDFVEPLTNSQLKQRSRDVQDRSPKLEREAPPADEGRLPSYKQDAHLKSEPDLLNEPAIISNTLDQLLDAHDAGLISAKLKSSKTDKLSDVRQLLSGPEQKENLADLLTQTILDSIIKECVALPAPREEKPVAKPELEEEQKEQNVDVYLVDSHVRDKEEKKEWVEIRQRHLIENDLIRIDQYINEIVDSLLQFEIELSSDNSELARNMNDNYHIQFLKQLTQPIQKEPTEILQALQTSEIGSYKHFETTQDLQKYPIIPVDLYLDIEKAREEAMIQRKGPNISKETQLVWESIHIQNKSFFDAVNESLMKFRPYGLTGEPMPWSNKIRRLQTKVDINSVDTERLFQMVKQEVFRWAQTYCGCLPSPIFAFPSHRNKGQEDFNNELFQEFREKRQTQVLWTETVEQEHHWLNFDYEEAQVKVDLSDMILEHLVDELVEILAQANEDAPTQPEVTSSVASSSK